MKVREAIEELQRLPLDMELVDENRRPIIRFMAWNFDVVPGKDIRYGNHVVAFVKEPWGKK
jgi:hypothetical protein